MKSTQLSLVAQDSASDVADKLSAKGKAALELAKHGYCVIPLYGLMGSQCTCGRGPKCPQNSRGKHPRIAAWQENASCDEATIIAWWTRWPDANVGVVLGERSRIVDLECDSTEAADFYEKLFDGHPPRTQTFQSRRGEHHLFKWRPDLPGGASMSFSGVDFKFGNDRKGTQSVFPPSQHHSGIQYEWIVTPEECELAELPDSVVDKLRKLVSTGSGRDASNGQTGKSVRRRLYEQESIPEGERNSVIHAEACAFWRERLQSKGPSVFDCPAQQSDIYERMLAWNAFKCRPPLESDEVQAACNSAAKFIRSQSELERARDACLTTLGLEYRDGEYWPGQWYAEVTNSDPPVIRLFAPFLPNDFIELSAEQYDSPTEVHRSIFKANPCVVLDDGILPWRQIWSGKKSTKKSEKPIRALKAKLADDIKQIEAAPETKREHIVPRFILEVIEAAQMLPDDREPSPGTVSFRRPDGSLWFRFEELLTEAAMERRADKFTRNEFSRVVREAGAVDKKLAVSGRRLSYMRLDRTGIDKLRKAAGDDVE